ncbi:MAG: ATP-binding cassette domain-containing protein [Steroidobacteraceae bacterium]
MLEARELCKHFGAVRAADRISFAAADGRITGLLGPNGAGKSTALRMLYTVLEPDSGQALVDGIDTRVDALAARRRIGVLTHVSGLYAQLTARENILYYAALQGMTAEAAAASADKLIERLDMRGFADRRTRGYSQGQRLKTSLARALVHGPRNILLDEPTNGLDVMALRHLRRLIGELREEGCCVLFSSHVMQEVASLCDEVIVIAGGRVVLQDSLAGVRERTGRDNLEDAFLQLIGSGEGIA